MTDRGLRASGYIVAVSPDNGYGCSYSVLCDRIGRTRRLTVQADGAVTERGLLLTRTPGGRWLDGAGNAPPDPGLDRGWDVDLSASAFTNSLAVRRLGLHQRQGMESVLVASVGVPDLAVAPVLHHYRTLQLGPDGATLVHRGPAGERRLTVDRDGFVLDLAGISRRLR